MGQAIHSRIGLPIINYFFGRHLIILRLIMMSDIEGSFQRFSWEIQYKRYKK